MLRRPTPPDLSPGALLGEYRIEAELGAGGYGQVFKALHLPSDRVVAVKVLRPEMVNVPTILPRFIREVEALSRIIHENIVQVYSVGELTGGVPYYSMELLEGKDLRELLREQKRLSPRETVAILEPVAAALHCAHEQDIIHRDIKASNIFIAEIAGRRVIKLLDFGVAKLMYGDYRGDGLTAPGTIIGTPHSMAPEQIRCEALDCRADIYSLGVLAFRLLTGRYPFNDPNRRAITVMHLQAPPPRASELAPVSSAIDEVILKCMAKAPDDRYSTVIEFLEAFRRACDDEPAVDTAKGQAVDAIGIRLEVGAAEGLELDDDMIEDIAEVLDIVECELEEDGFEFPLRASNGLTAIRLIEEGSEEDYTLDDAEGRLGEIREILDERDGAHPDVVISLVARQDSVECRPVGDGVTFVGGALLELDTWGAAKEA
ncbi:MAG: serine/threonine protein kinase [Myxococcales bacterium]|nr:serine/threonine protein kinase [Myxococcales bacterium]